MADYSLGRREGEIDIGSFGRRWIVAAPSRAPASITWVDGALICLFLIGMYTNFTIMISEKVPFPSVPSGVAGMLLLWRRRDRITPKALACFMTVVGLYLISILWATNITFLGRRTNGLLQLTYSLTIGYALFLTVTQAHRRQIAALFLSFALVIAIGCLLETYGGLKGVSDSVRQTIYSSGVYESDLRDVLLYKRVRPKFFASEPASVTFCYALLTFLWFVMSRWRWKLLFYIGLFGLGLFAMPGPTLLLMLILTLPYMLFLASRRPSGRLDFGRLLAVACLSVMFVGAFVVLAQTLYAARLEKVMNGDDPSFFYRVQGPAMAAGLVIGHYPLAGAGLTGEPFIEGEVTNLFVRSPAYSASWQVISAATELLINFFWLHWIYLGLMWGVIIAAAITIWLVVLGVPSPAFCWMVWAILGQAAGAYVGPTCWAVLFLAGAAAVLRQRKDPVERRKPPFSIPTLRQRYPRRRVLRLVRPPALRT